MRRDHAQRVRTAVTDLEREDVVGSSTAQSDRGDRLARVGGGCGEAIAGVNHQRGADDQHRVGDLDRGHRALTRSRARFSPKNTTSGFSSPLHDSQAARRSPECGIFQIGISVWRFHRIERREVPIPSLELRLQLLARAPSLAAQAAHRIDAAVQIDHVLTAGRLMQPIDVLRNELNDAPAALEGRE